MVKGTVVMFWFFVIFLGSYYAFYQMTKKGASLTMRSIAGLDAIEEAVGRSTEMGKPVHYTFGIGEFDTNVLASFSVLSHTASICARLGTDIIVTNARPEVHPITEDIVRTAFIKEGKADSYKPDNIRYLSEAQTAYVAAIYGIFTRERPAANIMLGPFFAETLLLGEVGRQIGAIQIGGTGRHGQTPTFVAACDYTLIGDELFAAGAYVSKEPLQLSAIVAQDIGKWLALVMIVVGTILATLGNKTFSSWLKM